MRVTFFLDDEPHPQRLERLDPDRDWREFVTGERAWVLQTYLRLRARGCDVELSTEVPDHGIVVFSAKQRRLLLRHAPGRTQALLVGIREDVGEALIADLEVVQNRSQADGRRRFFIPFWPQPGLLPRDAARGNRIETIAFKGFIGNLHPDFRDAAWCAFLAERGIRWLADAAPYRRHAVDAATLDWNDFRNVDLIVAVRAPDAHLHRRKPGTKLYNAWHAGVPAIVGPELAYRELRRSSLDYLEVASPAEAREAIARLQADPALYSAMIDNGRERAREFTVEGIAEHWEEFLTTTLPRQAQHVEVQRWRGRSLLAKELSRRALRALGMWPHRL